MSKAHLAYFEEGDVLHLTISDEPEAGSVELSPNVTAELNEQGELIGIEILEGDEHPSGLARRRLDVKGRLLLGHRFPWVGFATNGLGRSRSLRAGSAGVPPAGSSKARRPRARPRFEITESWELPRADVARCVRSASRGLPAPVLEGEVVASRTAQLRALKVPGAQQVDRALVDLPQPTTRRRRRRRRTGGCL